MTDDRISAEITPTGGSLEVKGDGAGRLTNQLADLLSIFSEPVGYLGDKFRVWRQVAVIRSLQRAQEIAQESGLALQPVSPKFLVNWVEKASLEDDDLLTDRWARLLLSGMGRSDHSHFWATNVLAELSPEEAKILDNLGNRGRVYLGMPGQASILDHYSRSVALQLEASHQRVRDRPLGIYDEGNRRDFFFTIMKEEDFLPLLEVFEFQRTHYPEDENPLKSLGGAILHGSHSPIYAFDVDIPFEHLLQKGLVKRATSERPYNEGFGNWPGTTILSCIYLTVLGGRFLRLVNFSD
jgi:hypothetical protein